MKLTPDETARLIERSQLRCGERAPVGFLEETGMDLGSFIAVAGILASANAAGNPVAAVQADIQIGYYLRTIIEEREQE